jgi:hypothetical protein
MILYRFEEIIMAKDKFTLLKTKKPGECKDYHDDPQIMEWRQQARKLRDENNRIVKELWDMDLEMADQATTEATREELKVQRDRKQKEIDDKNIMPKLNALLKKIEDREKSLFGHSDVNSSSPYIL